MASDSQIKINYRSNRQDFLETLHNQIMQAAQEACDEETARWGADTVTWDTKQYVDVDVYKRQALRSMSCARPCVRAAVGVSTPSFSTCITPV